MSIQVTAIQLTRRDTVNFYVNSEIVRNMSQIVPATSTYIQRNGNDIIIVQPQGGNPYTSPNGANTNNAFVFSSGSILTIGSTSYTPIDPNDPDSAALAEARAITIYNYIVNNIFKGCCDCSGGGGGCSIQWEYNSGLGTGTWYYASGVLLFDFTSYLNQDFQAYLAQLPDGSQITLVSDADESLFVIFEVSGYSAISGYAAWSATIIDGISSYTEATVWCVTFQPALGGGGGSQNWQETLIVGPNLTQDNTSNAGGFSYTWTNFASWVMSVVTFTLNAATSIAMRTTGAASTFSIRHDATANPLQVDVNASGGTTWNTLGPTRFIGDTNNEITSETTGFGDYSNQINFKATNDTATDIPNERTDLNFYNNKNDGNGSRKWFALRHTDLSTIEVFGLYAYDPAGAAVLDRWVIAVAAGAFSNPYSNNTFIGQLTNPTSIAYPFAEKIKDLIANGSLVLMHSAIDIFNNTLLAADDSYANSPIIRFVPRSWINGDPTELFGLIKHAYVLQQQFSTTNGDSAWQVGFKDNEIDALPALLRSLLLYYDGTVQLGAYPSSRDDGAVTSGSTKLVYVDATGKLKVGTATFAAGVTPAALTKADDTNVTLTLGGTPATSLLQAVSITAGWTGTLADARIASAATWNAKISSYHAPFCLDANSDQVNASSTSYYNPYTGSASDSTEATRQNIVPVGGTAKIYSVMTLGAQPASGSCVITLRKNTAATAITLTIAAGSAAGIFTDNVNTVAVTRQVDLLSHQVVNNATGASATFKSFAFVIESTE